MGFGLFVVKDGKLMLNSNEEGVKYFSGAAMLLFKQKKLLWWKKLL